MVLRLKVGLGLVNIRARVGIRVRVSVRARVGAERGGVEIGWIQ